MSTYDLILLVILCAFGVRSLMKGLIGEIMSIIGFVVAFLCGRMFGHTVGVTIFGTKNPWLSDPAGYMIVFVLVMVAAWGLSFILKISVKKSPVNWVNKAGGFVFGALLGAVILSLALLAMKSVEINARKLHLESPTKVVFQTSILANAIPKYTICLLVGDMMKTCGALGNPPPAPTAAPAKSK